jgi:UDP-N-acetyl-D-mannosaminuronic acid dehydrogenase
VRSVVADAVGSDDLPGRRADVGEPKARAHAVAAVGAIGRGDTMRGLTGHDVVIVGGCGHVGLPLGIVLARSGASVALVDVDEDRKQAVRAGRMPFIEYGAEPLLQEVLGSTLEVVDDLDVVTGADYVVVTIGTPVDEYLSPRHHPLFDLATEMAPHLRSGHQVVLRSTVFPGTTRELGRHFASVDASVHVSYCPERIAQGYAITELDRLPQIVSGLTDDAVQGALRLFGRLTDRLLTVEVEEAELAKLFLNSWRYIQFAIANQFYMIAEDRGLDFFRIHHAMTHGYDRAADFPPPGLTAGPCLLKDTMQLSAFERSRFHLGHAAMVVNEGLVEFIVERLSERHDLRTKTVGILGMAFKRDIDDLRDSLAFKLRKLLTFRGARVLASDAFAVDPTFVPVERLLDESDIIVLGAPHAAYRRLELPSDKEVVDVWGFFGERALSPARV